MYKRQSDKEKTNKSRMREKRKMGGGTDSDHGESRLYTNE